MKKYLRVLTVLIWTRLPSKLSFFFFFHPHLEYTVSTFCTFHDLFTAYVVSGINRHSRLSHSKKK